MPRYKLRIPQEGDFLYGDGDTCVVAETEEDAIRHLLEEGHEPEDIEYLEPSLGFCRVVYARDVENGDCHEDAEPGDTTVDYMRDDGREIGGNVVRVWTPGMPMPFWRTEHVQDEERRFTGRFRAVFDGEDLGEFPGGDAAMAAIDERRAAWREEYRRTHVPTTERLGLWPTRLLVQEHVRRTEHCSVANHARRSSGAVYEEIMRRADEDRDEVLSAVLDELKWGESSMHAMMILWDVTHEDPTDAAQTNVEGTSFVGFDVRQTRLLWLEWGAARGLVKRVESEFPFLYEDGWCKPREDT